MLQQAELNLFMEASFNPRNIYHFLYQHYSAD